MVDASPLIAIEERAETLRRGPQVGRDPSRRSLRSPKVTSSPRVVAASVIRHGHGPTSRTDTSPANVGHGDVIGDHESRSPS